MEEQGQKRAQELGVGHPDPGQVTSRSLPTIQLEGSSTIPWREQVYWKRKSPPRTGRT